MSGGSAPNNTWTILSSEETVAETLKPLTESQEGSHASAAVSGEERPSTSVTTADRPPVDEPLESEEKTVHENPDFSSGESGALHPDPEVGPTEDQTETLLGAHLTSPSDPYTPLMPNVPPVTSLSAETLGGAEEQLSHVETVHLQKDEDQKVEESADGGKQGESGLPEQRTEDGRKKSLLEQIGRTAEEEEEEEEEEEFQVPQREHDSIFSLNKCIVGALLLLGIGTVFFSENDYATRELADTDSAGKQDWLNPDVPPPHVDDSELVRKLAEGNQQISALQDQLQAQKEELKVAQEQAAEGAKQRLLWEEVEKENGRLKAEVASLNVLQKENDRMKKELESVPTLQTELETLRSTVTKLKHPSAADPVEVSKRVASSPPGGQSEDGKHNSAVPGDKRAPEQWGKKKDGKEKYSGKEGRKREQGKEENTEWKNGKVDGDKETGKQKWQSEKEQQGKDKAKVKTWKDKEGRNERKQEKDQKKGKYEKNNGGKEWKGKDKKTERHEGTGHGEDDWKRAKDKKSGHESWNRKEKEMKNKNGKERKGEEKKTEWHEGASHGENDWKRKKSGQESWGWKEKELTDRAGRDGRGKGEAKQWEGGGGRGKERKGNDERKLWSEQERKSKHGKEMERKRKEGENQQKADWKKKNLHEVSPDEEEQHLYGERKPPHTHPSPPPGQPEYWLRQRERLQHNPRPLQPCGSAQACAQAEHLLPVALPDFQAVLQPYLTRAQEAGVDPARTQELARLASEFFRDGVFVHERLSFQNFVEDLGAVLEDLVEEQAGEEDDSDLEDEMEEFEREALKRFSLPAGGAKDKKVKGEWGREGRQERG